MNARSIVLTGFMGSGKTSVGRAVAAKLAREFVDMDAAIEAREGGTIRSIFEVKGEAHFREIESALCAELSQCSDLVIATGGGTLVNPDNCARFASLFVVCLDATADDVLARVGRAGDRPLLAGGDPHERVQALLDARREAYAQIRIHVNTTDKTIEQIADQVIALYHSHSRPLTVPTPDGQYSVFVGAGLLTQAGAILRQLDDKLSCRCALVTNPTVGNLHAPRVIESLHTAGFDPCVIEIPDGERFKTLDMASVVYNQLIDAQLDRRSAIVALGGGVIGDLAGFVAATYLRGVPFVQLPTTLLAMVDASIGGKVAVDHPRGKNLIGAFKQPLAVLADTDTLATLPDKEWRCGMAEVVKHGVIGDRGLFEKLEAGNWRLEARGWIKRAIQVKVEMVARDPFEQNERAKLNLGHTFGHALERLSNLQLQHGEAVAIGVMCAARLAARLGICDDQLVPRVENLLSAVGLPTRVPGALPADAIVAAMMTDKKRVNGRLRFVLPRALGDVVIADDVPRDQVMEAIESSR